jgi:hypothetical protein
VPSCGMQPGVARRAASGVALRTAGLATWSRAAIWVRGGSVLLKCKYQLRTATSGCPMNPGRRLGSPAAGLGPSARKYHVHTAARATPRGPRHSPYFRASLRIAVS